MSGRSLVWWVAGVLLCACSGCSTGYLIRQAAGQVEILSRAQPLEVLQGAASPEEQAGFTRVRQTLAMAQAEGLDVGESYRSYVDLGGRPPVWVLFASLPDRLEAVRWEFPLVGSFPYKGFFDRSAAVRAQRMLEAQGYETMISAGSAYSTLGWFDDPLFRRFLASSPGDLEETVFHELTHATVFFPGKLRFNENLAEFVGVELATRLLSATHGADAEPVREYQKRVRDRYRLRAVMADIKRDLDRAFEQPTRAARLAAREEVFAQLSSQLAETAFETDYARGWKDVEWSNPRILGLDLYRADQDVFADALQHSGGDMPRFIALVASVHEADDPVAALRARLSTVGAAAH